MMDVMNQTHRNSKSIIYTHTRTEGGNVSRDMIRYVSGRIFLQAKSKGNSIVLSTTSRMGTMETHRNLKDDDCHMAYGTCCYYGCTAKISYPVSASSHPIYCQEHAGVIKSRYCKEFPLASDDDLYWLVHRPWFVITKPTKQMRLL